MKIATFGYDTRGLAQPLDFFSDRGLWDFDAVIYDLEKVLAKWLRGNVWHRQEDNVLTDAASTDLIDTFVRRANEMREFMEHGHPVLIFPSVLPRFRYLNEDGNWPQLKDLGEFFPACGVKVEKVTGEKIEIRGSSQLQKFGKTLEKYWWYGARLKEKAAIGTPCFFIPKANHVLGSLFQKDKRWLLISPRISDDGAVEIERAFLELYASTSKADTVEPLPIWHSSYALPGEHELQTNIRTEQQKLHELTLHVDSLVQAQQSLLAFKRLFTDKGSSLVTAVARALEGLGFKVAPGPEGRDDLIATFEKSVAVVEVKGKDRKSAAEADAAQLEKWVIRYYEEHGVMPKGILVANPFREIPLLERTEESFPDQMLAYATGRSHCLISGLQLLCLYFDAAHRQNGRASIEELFSTKGRFARYRDKEWQTAIRMTQTG